MPFDKAAPSFARAIRSIAGSSLFLLAAACSSDSSNPGAGGSVPAGGGDHPTDASAPGSGGSSGGTGGVGGSNGSIGAGGGQPGDGTASGSGGGGGNAGTGGNPGTGGTAGSSGNAGGAGANRPEGGARDSGVIDGSAGTRTDGGVPPHSGVWRVMPLGDSITASTCYPQLLAAQLKTGGHSNFQFVGTQTTNQSCGANAPSVATEGHGGYGVTYLLQNSTRAACTKTTGCGSFAELQTWAAEKPEIVLMHYGTNDVWDGQSPASILSAYVSVITEFRKQNPNVIFFVSKIIKLSPAGCGNCLANVASLAAAVTDAWASTNSMPTSPIYLVDDYDSGFDPTSTADTADGVHPTPAGAAKVATATYNGVIAPGLF